MAQQTLYRYRGDAIGEQSSADISVKNNKPNTTRGNFPFEIGFHDSLNGLEDEWRELEKNANISIYQRFDWVSSSIKTIDGGHKSKTLIVTVREGGKLVIILPLIIKGGIITRLIWMGGKHSNFNMAIVEREFSRQMESETIVELFNQISQMLPEVAYMELCCQPLRWEDQINPLLALQHQPSTNIAFGMDLSGGFEHALAFGNAKRKRKKFRYQVREVEKHGGARLIQAKYPEQIDLILNEFYRQKTLRFANLGMRDVFDDQAAKDFIKELAVKSLTCKNPILAIYALEIGGQYRAIMAGGRNNGRFSACFSSFREDELSHLSPGEMMLHMLVKKLSDENLTSIDLGAGDERYKRSWCSERFEMFDVIIPITFWSVPIVMMKRLVMVTRRLIRENSVIWENFKQSRINWNKVHRIINPQRRR